MGLEKTKDCASLRTGTGGVARPHFLCHTIFIPREATMTPNAPYGCQTYKDLLVLLASMSPEQLDCTPTIYDADNDEYYPFSTLLTASDTNSVLDEDHPYFSF